MCGVRGTRRARGGDRVDSLADGLGPIPHNAGLMGPRLFLSRIRPACLGGAPRRPSGEVDRRALQNLPQRLSGPRPDGRGRAPLDEEGNFLAVLSNLGGHAAAFVSLQKGLGLMSSVYRIPIWYFRGRRARTNTLSATPYRH